MDLSRYTPEELAVIREFKKLEDATVSIEALRGFLASSGHPDFKFPHVAHHAVEAAAFEELILGDSYDRLLVIAPWGSAKSTILNIQATLWFHTLFPDGLVLSASATQSLSEEFQRRKISALESEEAQRFGLQLDPNRKSAKQYKLLTGGGSVAAGVETSVIGHRADLLILDDPIVSFEAAESSTLRNNLWNWYRTVWRSRLKPGGKELIVTTRWHADDIAGRILKSDEADTWKVIRIPMIADTEPDPVGRGLGQRLWPEHYRERDIVEAQRDLRVWAGSYQGLPLQDEGDWLGPEDLPVVDMKDVPSPLGVYAAVDIAMTDGAGDYSVIMVAGIDAERRMWLLDVWRDRVSPEKIVDQLVKVHKQWKPRTFLIEKDVASFTFLQLTHELLRQRGSPVYLKAVPHKGRDKETKAAAFRGFAKQGSVRLVRGPWVVDFLREADAFPFGAHDDQVDCAGLLGRHMVKMGGSRVTAMREAQQKPIEGQIQRLGGHNYLRETLSELYHERDSRSAAQTIARRRI